jgi:glycosyltransferase A (GT-A) superfamily protein (DUF2064 family)
VTLCNAGQLRVKRDADVAFSPDRDGGYGLVALGRRALLVGLRGPSLFDHPMSTPSVLADTRARATRLGLRSCTVTPGFDIDRAEDLVRLARAFEDGDLDDCARTVEWIRQNDLWPVD